MKVSGAPTANQTNAPGGGAASTNAPTAIASFAAMLSVDVVAGVTQGGDTKGGCKSSEKQPGERDAKNPSRKAGFSGVHSEMGAPASLPEMLPQTLPQTVPQTLSQGVAGWAANLLNPPANNGSANMPILGAVRDDGDGADASLRAPADGEQVTSSSRETRRFPVQPTQGQPVPSTVSASGDGKDFAGANAIPAATGTDPQAERQLPGSSRISTSSDVKPAEAGRGMLKPGTGFEMEAPSNGPVAFTALLNPWAGLHLEKVPQTGYGGETGGAKPGTRNTPAQAADDTVVPSTATESKGMQPLALEGSKTPAGAGAPGDPLSSGATSAQTPVPTVNSSAASGGQQHREGSGDSAGSAHATDSGQQLAANKEGAGIADVTSAAQALVTHASPGTRNDGAEPRPAAGSPYTQMLADHVSASVTARALGSALRSDVHIGLQTEAFGRVTIQASAEGGQLSAQLLVENIHQSAALSAHLPALEQRLSDQSKLETSVSLVNDTGTRPERGSADANGRDPGSRETPKRNTRNAARVVGVESSQPARGIVAMPSSGLSGSRYAESSGRMKLDITV